MTRAPAPVVTLGVNAFTPNSSASLLVNDTYVGSAEEERFDGPKRAAVWPTQAIQFLLDAANLESRDVGIVAFNFDPSRYQTVVHDPRFSVDESSRRNAAFEAAQARLETRLTHARRSIPSARVVGVPHHRAHAAYAAAASGFEKAAVLILDSVGETVASSIWDADNLVEPVWTGPDYSSVGFFYGAVTAHLGWRPNDEEGTVMALAALGDPTRFRTLMRRLIRLDHGQLRIDLDLLPARVRRVRQGFTASFMHEAGAPRTPGSTIGDDHRDLAAAAQERLEELVMELARLALARTGKRRLIFSGGVAENCVANGKLAGLSDIHGLYIPPAPGDAGTSLGAALDMHPCPLVSTPADLADPLVGSTFDLNRLDRRFVRVGEAMSVDEAARELLDWCERGDIVGLIRGRFEFGPRALGNRSIIASPLAHGIGERLNRIVKHRESFRPFAPVVRAESVSTMFQLPETDLDLSTMSIALPVLPKLEQLNEIVHANGLARLQTVTKARNPVIWETLRLMEVRGDPGVLINTSLNVKGQPICGTATLLAQFAEQSSVRRYLIDETAYEFQGHAA